MTKIIIEYDSEDFRGIMFRKLDKIIDVLPMNASITIHFNDKSEIEKQ